MLAAYAPDDPALTPEDVRGQDLSVRAVVSVYGPSDLEACYYHTNQDKTTRGATVLAGRDRPARLRPVKAARRA